MSSEMTFFVVFAFKYLLQNDMDVTCTIILYHNNGDKKFFKTGGNKMYALSGNTKILRGGYGL